MKCTYFKLILSLTIYAFPTTSKAQIKDTLINAYFPSNAWKLDSLQNNFLRPLLARISCVKQITGFADKVGSNAYNMELSRKRAQYFATILDKEDVPCRKILYKGKDHEQDSLLWKNRKVEIIAVLRDPGMVRTESVTSVVASINLDNIYFVPDMARIREESLPYLEDLAKLLMSNYKAENFEIIGHVNYQSKKDSFQLRDLYMLSERRAKAVYEYLLAKGIPSERMKYRGVGNSQPVFLNPNDDEEKKKNMRVQVVVTKAQ